MLQFIMRAFWPVVLFCATGNMAFAALHLAGHINSTEPAFVIGGGIFGLFTWTWYWFIIRVRA